jgi:hypothetical protein
MRPLLLSLLAITAAAAPKSVDFDRDIRPILSDTCFACHGPDEKQRQAKLRLDTKDGLFAVVTPSDSATSRLYQRISNPNKALRMPPVFAERTLNEKQIELIRQWIDQGAKWEMHWAYVPPKRSDPPPVKNERWPRNPIDRFILARLDREGLKPSAEADKITLLRRVTFDLTGLPPTPAEVDEFLADKSPGAYEKVVDRLLASPRYGERMAMQWLDLARYADTHGYHIDSHRNMWHWRDWVIDAFNRNLPYNEFTIEQLAGDLLPEATVSQRLATGFNRNHMINFEGGAIPEEYQNEYVVDRLEATSTVWLGLTMGCARCHDHKYDPIQQKEFYQFYAFFNTIPEKGLDGRKGNAEPLLALPSKEEASELEAVADKLGRLEWKLAEEEATDIQTKWEAGALDSLPDASHDSLALHYEFDGNVADISGHYRHARVLAGDPGFPPGPVDRAIDFDGETRVQFGKVDADRFTLAFWMRNNGRLAAPVVRWGEVELASDESEALPGLKRGVHLIAHVGDRLELRTRDRIIVGTWYHVALEYDGKQLQLHLDGKTAPLEIVSNKPAAGNRNFAAIEIGKPFKGQIDDLRFYTRTLDAAEIEQLAIRQPVRATVQIPARKRSKDQKDRIREYFFTHGADPEMRSLYADVQQLKARKESLDEAIPTSMVMAEMNAKPRETAILGRGDYRNRGEKVTPGVPSVLPPLPKDAPLNRLTLARWLVDPAHPLTARVAVNRYWQLYFATGIVKTAQDFGSQGEAPTHPELLDWLATEFIRTGWDIKAMQKLIVTSATYRLSSKIAPELLEKDPENRLLARGPRFRLPAETVRDNALAVSGLLNGKIGGAPVFPYQPKGLWEEIAYGDVYSAQTYAPSHGKDLYRRSMYSFWKRTSPPPSLITFDAPDREKCMARRAVTNTPLQALVLMNDPTFVEAARTLAQRAILEAGPDTASRIAWGFRCVTARKPTAAELRVLRELEREQMAEYDRHPEAAKQLLAVGESRYDQKLSPVELAAWTTVMSTILNLDEAITKE